MVARELELRRISSHSEASMGYIVELSPNAAWIGFTLEDQKQLVKVVKETRIPAGRYRLTLNKSLTEKTAQYRKNYTWFIWHIMLNDVQGFSGIYIHIGNDDDDTEGCLLIGDVLASIHKYAEKPLRESTDAFKRFYLKYYPLLEENVPIYLTVKDEQF